jgi:hypothetical protein
MSKLSNGISRRVSTGIYGAIGLALTFGAAQFASGRDLGKDVVGKDVAKAESVSAPGINREAKADRAARAAGPATQMKTISFRLNGLPDTSVLLRLPVAGEAANGAAVAPAAMKSLGKPTLACEPVVSVLTEVAKRLQPGRCIT